jgi:hypothetical protein
MTNITKLMHWIMEDLVENDGMKNKFVGNVVKIIIKCNT